VLIFADEAIWGGNVQAANRLKAMITETRIAINRKFMEICPEDSALHIIAASNEQWAAHIDPGDRRFCILDVAEDQRINQSYFNALHAELEKGGRAAMLAELLALDVDWELQRRPPMTRGKASLMIESASGVAHWWDTCLREGFILDTDTEWPERVQGRALYEAYMAFHTRYHGNNRSDKLLTNPELRKFFEAMRQLVDDEVGSKVFLSAAHRFKGTVHRGMSLLSLEECRERWLQVRNLDVTWEEYAGADHHAGVDADWSATRDTTVDY